MHQAFPGSDYYGSSAPSCRHRPATGLPADRLAARRLPDQQDGSHVHSRTLRRGRRPAMPLQPRHGYAAGLHRGLPAGDINRPRSSPPDRNRAGARCKPAHIHQVSSWRMPLRGFQPLVPHVRLSVSLAGPGPSGSTGPSRRCQGCFHPPWRSPDQAALSFSQPAATSWRRCPFTTARFKSASWRSMSWHHATSGGPGANRRRTRSGIA